MAQEDRLRPPNEKPTARVVKQYEDQLSEMAKRIKNKDPDYILAISRSGPRLLELLSQEGLYSNTTPIISEKALDFIPSNNLNGSSIVVFDDVTNTGKTMIESQLLLQARYDLGEINPITFGYDKETSRINISEVEPQLILDSSKRYEIIKGITQSFCVLNKPYDVDHPILYSEAKHNAYSKLSQHDEAYDLTTVQQSRLGFRRSSFLPDKKSNITGILSNILVDIETPIDIEKIRIYYDKKMNSVSSVPITSFPIRKDALDREKIFAEQVPNIFNRCMSSVERELYNIEASSEENPTTPTLYRSSPEEAKYRVLWYLVNYIYGIAYHEEYPDIFPELKSPDEFLSRDDIQYIFGPTLSNVIIEIFESNFEETRNAVNDLLASPTSSDWNNKISKARVVRDQHQSRVYDYIKDYVEQNTLSDMTYSDQLSTIFEATELLLESNTEEKFSDDEKEVEVKTVGQDRVHRKVGLNISHLKSLLEESNIEPPDNSNNSDQGYSLALDFLIDTGVAIPIFYEKENSEWLERVYRHGEGALNRMGYNFVIESVLDGLFDYIHDDTINRITLEKIGVMITDRLNNGRYWGESTTSSIYDFLTEGRKELSVAPEYHRHGRVVLHDSVGADKDFFAEWCERHDMVEEADGGVKRGKGWKHDHREDISHIKSTISDSKVQALENLAILLYEIDKRVDQSSNPNYLTALTSCRDKESYLNSLHAELQLFFSDSDWNIKSSISGAWNLCEKSKSEDIGEFIDRDLSPFKKEIERAHERSSKAHEAINAITDKSQLRQNLIDSIIITDVKEFFEDQVNRDKRRNYRRDLKPYLDNIQKVDEFRGSELETAINRRKQKTETFGELCIHFSTAYRSVLDICGNIIENQTDLREEFSDLYGAIEEMNQIVDNNSDEFYSGQELGDIPKVDLKEVDVKCVRERGFEATQMENTDTALILTRDLLTQLLTVYDILEEIYDAYFEEHTWSLTLDEMFLEDRVIEADWVVWYDIKNSSDPSNAERTDQLKTTLEDNLDRVSATFDDGEFEYSDDDEKHIFVKEDRNVVRYIRTILEQSELKNMTVRISVCSLPAGNIEKDGNKIKSNQGHLRAVRVGDELDKDDEKMDSHYLLVTRSARERICSKEDLIEKLDGDYSVNEVGEDSVSLKDSDVIIPIYIYEIKSTS